MFHDRSKHIAIRYHFIRDWVQKGAVKLEYISIDEQTTNILTKSLTRGKHFFFKDKLGVVKNPFLGKRECRVLVYLGKWSPSDCLSTKGGSVGPLIN